MTLLDHLAARVIVPAATLLRADLNDAPMLFRDVSEPSAFFDEHAERLFDIYIFACGAGHHRHQAMPMVGRGYHHRLNILVVEELPEIAITFGVAAARSYALLHPRLVGVAHGDHVDVFLVLEVEDVLRADQPVSDEANADTIVGAEDAPIRRGRCGGDNLPAA